MTLPQVVASDTAHALEHSLEVQLPFLQLTLDDFALVPFAVGYIEIPGELRVEARLTDVDFADLRIGMEMTVTTIPFAVDDDGTEVVTFAFRPVNRAS